MADGYSQIYAHCCSYIYYFQAFDNKWIVYVVGLVAVAISLYIGVDMFNKNNKK